MSIQSDNTVFVTGGTGLVGTHVLVKLIQEGNIVRALKRENSDLGIVKKVFAHYQLEDKFGEVIWVDGDITDITSLPDAIGNATKVYHAAALVSFDPRDKRELYQLNIDGTANVVNACLEKKIDKLCYVSSTAAVGKSKEVKPVVETNDWIEEEVTSNYSISKHYAENEVWRGVAEGLDAVVVNPCVVIGPGDWNRSSGTLFKTIKNGLKFFTSGANAFVDARDVADVMFLLMESTISGDRFLVIGENLSYKSLFGIIAKSLGVKAPTFLVKGFLINAFWRLEKVRSLILGRAPVVTSESAKTAVQITKFSSQKLIDATGFTFRSIDDAANSTAEYYKNW